jgi:AraC family transcriptional regulator
MREHTHDTVYFESDLFAIGRFHAPVTAQDFASAGHIVAPVFVFPRTSVWIQHAGRPAFVADIHAVTLYNTGQVYERRAIDPEGDICDWFRIKGALAAEVAGASGRTDDPDRPFTHDRLPAQARLCLFERALFHQLRTSPDVDILHVEETVIGLLGALLIDADTPRRASGDATARRRGLDVIEHAQAALGATLTNAMPLASVASTVGCSPFHLCRAFRRATGMTLHAYRDRLRLFLALHVVFEDRTADLTQAALHAGYSSHSHFTWAFRRTFGATPSQIRALARLSPPALRDAMRAVVESTRNAVAK